MEKEKFTPGPWTVETRRENISYTNVFFSYDFQVIAESAGKRVCYSKTDKKENIDELNANAALISAAPEMYNFGKMVSEFLQRFTPMFGAPLGLDKKAEELIDTWERIARKARGGE